MEEVKVPRSCTDDLKMFVEKVMIMRIVMMMMMTMMLMTKMMVVMRV